MQDIEKNVEIFARMSKVWAALTDPITIDAWMGYDGASKVDLRVGGSYELFGGETIGHFTRIDEPNLLEYTWRMTEWAEDWPDSLVRWELEEGKDSTRVRLTHSNLPNLEEREGHSEGWDVYFLEPMREWLEAGAGDSS